MEAKDNKKQPGSEGDKYVTKNYMKQLEIQKENALITEVEEQINQKRTANAETGMTGFYTNFMNNQGRLNTEDSAPEQKAVVKQDFRGKMEDKLRELKAKQAVREEEQK